MRTTLNQTKMLIFSVFFLLQGLQLVAGDSGTRVDLLKGKNGESACTLKDDIYTGCPLTPPSTFNATYETPATCTCNKVFFNIWSACSYSSGINTLPLFSDWISICQSSGINLVQAQVLADRNTWGVDAPQWARIDVPGNTTIDLQNAVLMMKPSWTTFQIILPIITAVGAFIVTFFAMLFYQSRSQKAPWGGRIRRLIHPIPKVENIQKNDTWEIESSIDDARRYDLVPPTEGSVSYPFAPSATPQLQAQRGLSYASSHHKSTSETFEVDDSESWRVPASLRNFQMPWKKGRNRVQEVTATTEFDIDDYPMSSGFFPAPPEAEHGHRKVGSMGHEGDERSVLMSSTDRPPSALRDRKATPVGPAKSSASTTSGGRDDDLYSDPFIDTPR